MSELLGGVLCWHDADLRYQQSDAWDRGAEWGRGAGCTQPLTVSVALSGGGSLPLTTASLTK